MFVLLYFIPPFLAYRMGARGGWFVSIIFFSWPAFIVWLIARKPTLFAERERKREAAELERTLMLVRALNPAMADEIEAKKAYERVAPLMAAPPPAKPLRPFAPINRRGIAAILIVALCVWAISLAQHPSSTPSGSPQQIGSLQEPRATASSSDAQCAGLLLMMEEATNTYLGMFDSAREIGRLHALGLCGRDASGQPDKAAADHANQRALAAPVVGHPDYNGVRSVGMPWHGRGE